MGIPKIRRSRKQFHSVLPGDPLDITYLHTRVVAGPRGDAPPFAGHVRRSLGRNPEVSAAVIGIQWRRVAYTTAIDAPPPAGTVTRTLSQPAQAGEHQNERRLAAGWQFPFPGAVHRALLPNVQEDLYQFQPSRRAVDGQRHDVLRHFAPGGHQRSKTPGIDVWLRLRRGTTSEPLVHSAGRSWRTGVHDAGEPLRIRDRRLPLPISRYPVAIQHVVVSRSRVPLLDLVAIPQVPPRRISAGLTLPYAGVVLRAVVPGSGLDAGPWVQARWVAMSPWIDIPGAVRRPWVQDGTEPIPWRRIAAPMAFLPFPGAAMRGFPWEYQDRLQARRFLKQSGLTIPGGVVRRGPVIYQPPLLIPRRVLQGVTIPWPGASWRSVVWDQELPGWAVARRVAQGCLYPWPGAVWRLWLPGDQETAAELIAQRRGIEQSLAIPSFMGSTRRLWRPGDAEIAAELIARRRIVYDVLGGAVEALGVPGAVRRSLAPGLPVFTTSARPQVWIVDRRDGQWWIDDQNRQWDEDPRGTTWSIE